VAPDDVLAVVLLRLWPLRRGSRGDGH